MRLTQFTPTPRLVEAAAAGVRDDELFGLLIDYAGPEGWDEVARRLSEAVTA
jgi:hypothetical protein